MFLFDNIDIYYNNVILLAKNINNYVWVISIDDNDVLFQNNHKFLQCS